MVKMMVLTDSDNYDNMTYYIHKSAEDYGTFHVTTILIKRVRELIDGAPALIETDSSDPVKTAFEEFASGKLNITEGDLAKE